MGRKAEQSISTAEVIRKANSLGHGLCPPPGAGSIPLFCVEREESYLWEAHEGQVEGCTWLMLLFHWPALRSKATSDKQVVPKKSQKTPAAVRDQEETPWAFTFGTSCCINEDLKTETETALGCSGGKGFNTGDQSLTLGRVDCAEVREAAANVQEIGKGRNLREMTC